MPYAIKKVPRKNCYKVYNKQTKRVFARCTSKENATKQSRLLRAIMFTPGFVPTNRNNPRTRVTNKKNRNLNIKSMKKMRTQNKRQRRAKTQRNRKR